MTTAPQCCLPSLLAGISRLCVYAILCCRKHLYRLKCEHLFRPSPAGWQLVLYLQGWDIFSYVCCLSPGREWVTAGQRACAVWVSSTVPYVLAAVASLVCCCCLCSSRDTILPSRSDRGVLWTLWRWGYQAAGLVISTPTNLSAEPLHPSDIRGRGKTRLEALFSYSLPASIIR